MITRRLLQRAALCAGVIESLALLVASYWRDDGLSLHGGDAPEAVFIGFWATQIWGFWIATVPLGPLVQLVHSLLFLLLMVLLINGAVWTLVFTALGLAGKGMLRAGRLALRRG